ncbi:MAG: sigma-54-dependent Fis family transcriptional regulator [Deltaproteobacteria bacterium]|nr:sigma-54-dependent Fis family transcriptional regulator [Deltaproteobacteria bacterium]
MKDIIRLAETVANTKSSVLIQGETGTGKASMAKFVHEKSGRAASPCVTVNCAQQPEMLLETELFGFEKGAFAGTVSEKRGKFEQASGGTLILDDVTELTPKLQAKVLKVLETGLVDRIGSKAGVPVDVRIIAITNKNIAECASSGKFSESLYYKLNNAAMLIPPLRERTSDLKSLVATMMGRVATRSGRRVSGITEEAVQKLATHNYPGNLRELEGILERAMMNAQDGVIRATDVAVGASAPAAHQGAGAHSIDWEAEAQWAPGRTLQEIERAVILKSLAFHNGNRTHTARELGISIRTLRNKLNEYRKAGISV